MERDYKFTIGQLVYTYDEDEYQFIQGIVADKTSATVCIQWENRKTATDYQQYDFDKLKTVKPRNYNK